MPGLDGQDSRSLLAERPLTDDERAAVADPTRPGLWGGETGADNRWLSQDQTDTLIRAELFAQLRPGDVAERTELIGLVGEPGVVEVSARDRTGALRSVVCRAQRGGIDSEPLVRLLAFRAWGDRDRWWFWRGTKHRIPIDPFELVRRLYGFDRLTISHDDARGVYLVAAERGADRVTRAVADAAVLAEPDPRGIMWIVLEDIARTLGLVAPATRDVAAVRELARLAFGR